MYNKDKDDKKKCIMHLKHVKEHICLLLIKIFLRYFIYVLFFHKQDICEILIRHFWYLKNIIINLKHIIKEIYILYFSNNIVK